jgi:hypothetical protein
VGQAKPGVAPSRLRSAVVPAKVDTQIAVEQVMVKLNGLRVIFPVQVVHYRLDLILQRRTPVFSNADFYDFYPFHSLKP